MTLLKNKLFSILSCILLLLIVAACSNKINTWGSRQYHMATTRWNVYFNGKESLKKGQELIRQNYKENFDKLLPVYLENNIEVRESAALQMERAVNKAVKAIELHSITVKPKRRGKRESEKYREFRRKKEYNNMVDECYLLLGKAQFYRREYYSTERTFRYILREYRDMPIHYEAAIWYARTLAEQNKYFRALRTVEDVMKEEGFPEELIPMARAAKTDMFIRRGLYDSAIDELKYLTQNTRKKEGQTRYYYILAQLYSMQGDISKAQTTYAELVDTYPEYNYAFQAKLNRALLYGNYDLAANDLKVKTELKSLLRDGRNKNYLDQVYFAFARVYEKEENIDKAEENYKLSIENSTINEKQKAKTLLALGNLYFDKKKEYSLALENYREASDFITEDYPDYDKIKVRLEGLAKLAKNLKVIEEQDSLRRIAQKPILEREKFIKNLMLAERELKGKKSRKIKRALEESLKAIDRPIGEWYFYNPMAVNQGRKDFERKWGAIALTDNWRTTQQTLQLSAKERSRLSKKEKLEFRSYQDYVDKLPLTPQEIKESQEKSINALYEVGVIYEDEMNDYLKAKSSFENVLDRNPENEEKKLRANYHLYMLNSLLGNEEEAMKYKNTVMEDYPNSSLAKVLEDPNYYSKLELRSKEAELLYQKAYAAYEEKDFEQSKVLTANGMKAYRGLSTCQRFAFLNAMSKAYTESNENFKLALEKVKSIAIDERILQTTKALLSKLEKGEVPNQNISKETRVYTAADFEDLGRMVKTSDVNLPDKLDIPQEYKMEENAKHYFALVVPRDLKADVKGAIESFNERKFNEKKLRVRHRSFSLNTDIILVESFVGKEDALQYFGRMIVAQKDFLKAINQVDYTNLIISKNNLLKLTADRKTLPYLDFYAYHYLGEGAVEEEGNSLVLEAKAEQKHKELLKQEVDVDNLQALVGYAQNAEAIHNFVLIVPSRGVDVNYLWTALHHFDKRYKVKKERLGGKRMLVVEGIGTKAEALAYLRKVVNVDYIYDNLRDIDYRNFVITNENLKLLRSSNAVDNYIQFFKNNYL